MKKTDKYHTHVLPNLDAIAAYARAGASEEHIAEKLQINVKTLRKYRQKYPEFEEVLQTNRELADKEIENKAYQMAHGYFVTVKKPWKIEQKVYENGKFVGKEIQIRYVDEEIYFPPNAQVLQFWLCNRRREDWTPQNKLIVTSSDNVSEIRVKKDLEE